jgi:tRNA A-37 threonylcarbamoyl transferase component Bud32
MATLLGTKPRTISWVIGPRIDRPRSTIFLLRAIADSQVVGEAHYKSLYPPGFGGSVRFPDRAHLLHEELARSADMTQRLFAIASKEGIRPARVLVTDPDTLTLITERIVGRAVGSSLHRAVTPRAKAAALSIASRIGKAVRLIEETSHGMRIEGPRLSMLAIGNQITTAHNRGILSRVESLRLQTLIEALYQLAKDTTGGLIYAHGDLTRTNILRTEGGIGLIDFSWRAQLRSYDLAKFTVLLESVPYFRRGWTVSLVESLIEGYGDPEATLSPGWRLVRLQQQLRIAMRMHHPSSQRSRSHRLIGERAIAEIRKELRT